MLNLTRQERHVALFLISVALVGLGINFFVKQNSYPKITKILDVNLAKIDLNKATLEDLLESRCISKKLAEEIISFRNANGPFRDLEDLKEVKGIGDYRYEKLKELFFVE